VVVARGDANLSWRLINKCARLCVGIRDADILHTSKLGLIVRECKLWCRSEIIQRAFAKLTPKCTHFSDTWADASSGSHSERKCRGLALCIETSESVINHISSMWRHFCLWSWHTSPWLSRKLNVVRGDVNPHGMVFRSLFSFGAHTTQLLVQLAPSS
jgi:hypothetical protein